jgi:hypothetical protein
MEELARRDRAGKAIEDMAEKMQTSEERLSRERRSLVENGARALDLPDVSVEYPVYPFLLQEARRRGLTLERPGVPGARPTVEFLHRGLKSVGSARGRSFYVYLPSDVPISEDLYWAINDRVAEAGACLVRLSLVELAS